MSREIARILSTPGQDALFVIDTRRTPVEMRLHRSRPWIREGFASAAVQEVSPSDCDSVIGRLADDPSIPLAVVVGSRDAEWSVFSERLAACEPAGGRIVQVVDAGGRLVVDAVPHVDGITLDWTGSTTLKVGARNEVEARGVDFPVSVRLALRHPASPMNRVRVGAMSPFEGPAMRLPQPIWLRLTGDRTDVTLVVDVEPRADRDTWRWRVDTDGVQCAPVPPPPAFHPLGRVALVFDRTCPDWERWGDALTLAQGQYEGGEAPRDLNAGVRRGVRDAIAAYSWPPGARGCLTWFADVAGEGLASLKGAPALADPWGRAGEFALSDGPGRALEELTYLPGLDVWDPVEEGLSEAVGFFRRGGGGTLLIVGNSPPRVDATRGPFKDVACTFGYQTSWRVESDKWNRALHELACLGVSVFYVFLEHGARSHGQESDYQWFKAMQGRVAGALAASIGNPIMTAAAEAGTVQRAIEDVLDRAAAVEYGPSSVEILSVGSA